MSEPTPLVTLWVGSPHLFLTPGTSPESRDAYVPVYRVTDADARIAALEKERDEAVEDLAFCGASRNEQGELVMQMKRYHAVYRCERHRDDPWQDIDTEIDCFVCLTQQLAAMTQEVSDTKLQALNEFHRLNTTCDRLERELEKERDELHRQLATARREVWVVLWLVNVLYEEGR